MQDRDTAATPAKGLRRWARTGLTYAIAGLAGWTAHTLGAPLAWMLGPFFACAAASAMGVRLTTIPFSRQLAQITIGLGIGLRFTPETLLATLALTPAMLVATVYVIAYTLGAAFLFRPLAGVGRPTAFFATAAGGVADMAVVARDKGGDASAVALVQALRVSITVAVVPILVITFGTPGTIPDAAPPLTADTLLPLLLAFAVAILAARALNLTRLPNAWLVAPMLLGLSLGATGTLSASVPSGAILAAQLFLGTWLGTQFQREMLLALPRVALAGVCASGFMIVAAFAGALVLSAATGLPMATAFLALAPAAVTEMVITAKVMHLDPEIITGFHILRIFIVISTATLVYRLYQRIGDRLGAG
ncbi:AbrB family transcriptional regulator [Maliponia aquimaris]|uniref:Putative ammonia monooxygenase n=1 Tax=Maliponia aquimaris TaxID=1673631 RepID=A0A238KNQ5_9RHOB|nr:AbrB family transcriptional regulator [Maliponia aquimaris]SMX44449.1 Putative ammonia monooxygenase [Maliponia aquimaris]